MKWKSEVRNAENGLAAPDSAAASLDACLDFHGLFLEFDRAWEFVSASVGH
jgi:hypothetical protein